MSQLFMEKGKVFLKKNFFSKTHRKSLLLKEINEEVGKLNNLLQEIFKETHPNSEHIRINKLCALMEIQSIMRKGRLRDEVQHRD